MTFSRPIQWYHSHAGPIWLDGTFKPFGCLCVRMRQQYCTYGILTVSPCVLLFSFIPKLEIVKKRVSWRCVCVSVF
jgi:hypothetical protein